VGRRLRLQWKNQAEKSEKSKQNQVYTLLENKKRFYSKMVKNE
jgi:hypothetical protein